MIDVKHYVKYNSFLVKNVKLKTEIYISADRCKLSLMTRFIQKMVINFHIVVWFTKKISSLSTLLVLA